VPWYSSVFQVSFGWASSSVVFGRALNSVWVMSRPESTIEIGTPAGGGSSWSAPTR